MPISVTTPSGAGADYGSPFVGPVDHQASIGVDLSNLTDDEIDSKGYVKPGVPLTKAGALLGAGDFVYGCVIGAVKVAADNDSATIAALGVIQIAVATICQVNQDALEDILGRALTADEIAGFDTAGSKVVLL